MSCPHQSQHWWFQHAPKARRVLSYAAAFIALLMALLLAAPTHAQAATMEARPSTSGQLHVEDTYLTDEHGDHVVLHGVSTHGLQWYPQFVNDSLFGQLSDEWNCNLVRLALYSEDYCNSSPSDQEESLSILRRGIDACIAHDQYVIVDWHILEDNDPNMHLDEAKEFFSQISSEYANVPNLIYEICNEPNGETAWYDVYAYADVIIPIIRANCPQAVILVGTPVYSRELMSVVRHPLSYDNLMYTLHFYAATHREDLRGELIDALDNGLPVFVSECGLSESSGDGRIDFNSAVEWFDLLAEHELSYTIWSLSNKAESSALIRSTVMDPSHIEGKELTATGAWCRSLLQGENPADIPTPPLDAQGYLKDDTPSFMATLTGRDLRSMRAWPILSTIAFALVIASVLIGFIRRRISAGRIQSYDDLLAATSEHAPELVAKKRSQLAYFAILLTALVTVTYLSWRIGFSVPVEYGWLAVLGNLALLVVELFGFFESLIYYRSAAGMRVHPLPSIPEDSYPDVDIFIATYNEPCDLLRRTINGCKHLRYPDKSKVHIWVCDDNRRPEMRALAEQMEVGYFDRPDNKGAKAGNLNAALARTSAPYVVTLDADMIVRSSFLLKTIPYFVDAEQRAARLPEEQRVHLGFIQTPQCFYDPDVFQHALYAENRVTNEQDFFYRTIEVAKTSDNSVIYGGSNTILSRAALEDIGGFYTESITEDFATGLLIEAAGYVTLALPEPLASGRCPHTYQEHVKQRTRWGRGVIVTGRKLHIFKRRDLTPEQRFSYWSSVSYWYSPLKNFVYLLSPLLFAVFGLPVFTCSWLDLLIYWLPMFLAQSLCLRLVSGNAISTKWSGIHETSIMAPLFIPIIKETLGISLTTFKVTDKSGQDGVRTIDRRAMLPYLVLLALSVFGIVRVIWLLLAIRSIGLVVLLYWLVRNTFFLVMTLFLIDGRDSDGEVVRVVTADPITVYKTGYGGTMSTYEGIVTVLNEHSLRVYLDDAEDLILGDRVEVHLATERYCVELGGAVVRRRHSRKDSVPVHTIEILDYRNSELEYLQILYDRIPSLPQGLNRNFGMSDDILRNLVYRLARNLH